MAVRLREPTRNDVPLLDEWAADLEFRGEFNDFGMPPHLRASEPDDKPLIDATHGTLIIDDEAGTPVGSIDWRPMMYGPPPKSMAWQLGISLVPTARGRGYGSEALRLAVAYLFEHTPVNRIEGSCDVENVASQRMLEKAGFMFEGMNRGAQFRRGSYHDLRLYSVLRSDKP
jgi:RimJ/RimL family protein N-acetyltransferase